MNGALPNFIIIGTQKGGTTSLYRYLIQHPNILSASKKEIHFFDISFGKGVDWYKSHFPEINQKNITGEASPYYLFHPHAPSRIKKTIPNVKLIVLLRNPTFRAHSAYNMMFSGRVETLSFEEAIAKEEIRLKNDIRNMSEDPFYYGYNHQYFSYLSRGIYIEQLERWYKCFDPKNILVLKSEFFYNSPKEIYKQAINFLELPNWEPKNFPAYNQSLSKTRINKDTLIYLYNYYKNNNKKLYSFLGRDFGWEKEVEDYI